MSGFRVQRVAGHRLDEIYVYTREQWGEEQAKRYLGGMFARFQAIAAREFHDGPFQPNRGERFVCKYERHFIYWKTLADGSVGIVTVLHERMHQVNDSGMI